MRFEVIPESNSMAENFVKNTEARLYSRTAFS